MPWVCRGGIWCCQCATLLRRDWRVGPCANRWSMRMGVVSPTCVSLASCVHHVVTNSATATSIEYLELIEYRDVDRSSHLPPAGASANLSHHCPAGFAGHGIRTVFSAALSADLNISVRHRCVFFLCYQKRLRQVRRRTCLTSAARIPSVPAYLCESICKLVWQHGRNAPARAASASCPSPSGRDDPYVHAPFIPSPCASLRGAEWKPRSFSLLFPAHSAI